MFEGRPGLGVAPPREFMDAVDAHIEDLCRPAHADATLGEQIQDIPFGPGIQELPQGRGSVHPVGARLGLGELHQALGYTQRIRPRRLRFAHPLSSFRPASSSIAAS